MIGFAGAVCLLIPKGAALIYLSLIFLFKLGYLTVFPSFIYLATIEIDKVFYLGYNNQCFTYY